MKHQWIHVVCLHLKSVLVGSIFNLSGIQKRQISSETL